MNFRVVVAAAALILSTLAPATAQTPHIEMLEVVSSGFSGPGDPVERNRFLRRFSRTPAVTAKVGTAFAMTVRPLGQPTGADVTLRWVWRVPRPGIKDAKTGRTVREIAEDVPARIGAELERKFEFKDQEQIVRGNWRVEVWSARRRLAVRRFGIR